MTSKEKFLAISFIKYRVDHCISSGSINYYCLMDGEKNLFAQKKGAYKNFKMVSTLHVCIVMLI